MHTDIPMRLSYKDEKTGEPKSGNYLVRVNWILQYHDNRNRLKTQFEKLPEDHAAFVNGFQEKYSKENYEKLRAMLKELLEAGKPNNTNQMICDIVNFQNYTKVVDAILLMLPRNKKD